MVIGTAAPDFAFLLGGTAGVWSHRPLSLFLFCLPAGIAIYLALERFILPSMREASPSLRALFASRGTPAGIHGWIGAVAAILFGAVTHLIFDAFTHHDRWPGSVIFSADGAAMAHKVTSYAGSAFVLAWAVRRVRRRRIAGEKGDRRLAALLMTSSFFGGLTANLVADFFVFGHPTLGGGWKIFAGAFVGVLLASIARKLIQPPRDPNRVTPQTRSEDPSDSERQAMGAQRRGTEPI